MIPELQGATSGDIAEDAGLLVNTEAQVLRSSPLLLGGGRTWPHQ